MMKTIAWHEGPFSLIAKGRRSDDDRDRFKWNYALTVNGKVIFSAADFFTPKEATPFQAFKGLIGFLSLKPGDTDSEYFENYTEVQREFLEGDEVDVLQAIAFDAEEDPYFASHAKVNNESRFTLVFRNHESRY